MPRMNRKSYSYLGVGVNEGETEEAQRLRFQVELEFVQCLASPNYLHFLAQRNYFREQSFINYLKHLLYWKEPEYAKYIKYPLCLYFLDLLQHESFRKEIVNGQCAKFIDDQMILHWQHYTRKRIKILETGSQPLTNQPITGTGGLNTPGNNSPVPSSSTSNSHLPPPAITSISSPSQTNTANTSLLTNPILNSGAIGGNNSLPQSSVSVSQVLSGIAPQTVNSLSSSPRGASPGNLSPANVLNGHSAQKL